MPWLTVSDGSILRARDVIPAARSQVFVKRKPLTQQLLPLARCISCDGGGHVLSHVMGTSKMDHLLLLNQGIQIASERVLEEP
jgi:hypothetical protein